MARDHTRNISLTPELDQYVESEVASGAYTSASEVVRDGLRELQNRRRHSDLNSLILALLGLDPGTDMEAHREEIRGRLDALIQPALDQLERGESIPGDEVFAELRARIAKRRKGE